MTTQTDHAGCRPQLPVIIFGPRITILFSCLALLVFLPACQTSAPAPAPAPTPADSRAADETALREADAQWSQAARAGDVDKVVSYYASDALVLPPNGPALSSREAVHGAWKGMLSSPGAAISWKATKVEVARSGELGYVSGAYDYLMNGPDGKPVNDRGKFVEAWKKQPDGTWKCVADIWNSDLPAAPEKN